MRDTEIMEKGGAAYEARGRVFESPRAYHNPPKSQKLSLLTTSRDFLHCHQKVSLMTRCLPSIGVAALAHPPRYGARQDLDIKTQQFSANAQRFPPREACNHPPMSGALKLKFYRQWDCAEWCRIGTESMRGPPARSPCHATICG